MATLLNVCRIGCALLFVAHLAGCVASTPVTPEDACRVSSTIERISPMGTVRLAIVGDVGADAEEPPGAKPERMERLARALAAVGRLDGVVLLGDNFYWCGLETESDWRIMAPLAELGVPLFPVLGNHDYGCSSPADPCAQLTPSVPFEEIRRWWRFPALNYGVTWTGVATVAFVDTTPLAQGWISSNDVAAHAANVFERAPAPWKILAGHHVFHSSGFHGSVIDARERARMRSLLPAVRSEGVSVFLSGHDHHLELVTLEESLFVVSGSGSKVRYKALERSPGSLFRATTYGFFVLELGPWNASVEAIDLDGNPVYPAVSWPAPPLRRSSPREEPFAGTGGCALGACRTAMPAL